MLPGRRGFEALDRLDVRLVALLGLALLPIGLIAMVQTYRVIGDANARAAEALLGRTIEAASLERDVILDMRGAVRLTAAIIPVLQESPDFCMRLLDGYASGTDAIAFAGYVGEDGIVRCASAGVGTDLSDNPVYLAYRDRGRAIVAARQSGQISGENVIIVTEPVEVAGERAGYVAFSAPRDALVLDASSRNRDAPVDVLTFNAVGDVLTTQSDPDDLALRLPSTRSLGSFVDNPEPTLVEDADGSGTRRLFAVVPLLGDTIYAMSVWPPNAAQASGMTALTAVLFPFLMWLASLGVAFFAVHRLVNRHIRTLRMRIRAFSASRRVIGQRYVEEAPTELREVIESFDSMTERILRDEAELEDGLHEKDVLLKEVHHRVKNNLQLIASMTNMQMRQTKSAETRQVLRRLQDRVLGLATIHRNLYQASVLSHVRVDTLVRELVEQMVRGSPLPGLRVRIDVETDPISLYPDQAVPLSLLVTEAATNALKYLGRPPDGPAWMSVTLARKENDEIELVIANSMGRRLARDENAGDHATGVGGQLVDAFVLQLDAEAETHATDGEYRVVVRFRPSDFAAEP